MTDRIPPATAPSPQPSALRRVGEGCLWLILIGLVVYFGLRLASILLVVVLPTLLALVLAALLVAPVRWLRHHRVPPAAATLAVLVGVLVAIGALAAWIFPRVGGQLGELSAGLTDGLDEVERWLAEGPLGLSHEQVNTAFDRVEQLVRDNVGSLAQLGLTGATILLQLLAGLLLAVIVLFFFLKDGERLWNGLLGFVPGRHRAGVRVGGEGGWSGLGSFLRAQTLVALFDAVFIGLALVIVGVPLALPLTVITFLAAYVPYLGA
ncbi:MAG: AI-2E family transporter, partial [Actinomycetota bacterium]|nr:AI-2E family transporter [Actinomycetota bacterium]